MKSFDTIYARELKGGTNIYEPYSIIEESEHFIHLAESKRRKRIFVFAFNIMPLILLCLIPPVFIFGGNGLPLIYLVLMAACAILAASVLFFSRIIHDVSISDTAVKITSVRSLKKRTQSISIQDADHIYLDVLVGKDGGAAFRLCMKDTSVSDFITIPYIFMKSRNIDILRQRLKEVTGLNVEVNYIGKIFLSDEGN